MAKLHFLLQGGAGLSRRGGRGGGVVIGGKGGASGGRVGQGEGVRECGEWGWGLLQRQLAYIDSHVDIQMTLQRNSSLEASLNSLFLSFPALPSEIGIGTAWADCTEIAPIFAIANFHRSPGNRCDFRSIGKQINVAI